MSHVELAVGKVKHLDETQAEALLEWPELRENREALRQRLDDEIEVGFGAIETGSENSRRASVRRNPGAQPATPRRAK